MRAFQDVARRLENQQYPAMQRFYGRLRAAEATAEFARGGTYADLKSPRAPMEEASAHMAALAKDPTAPTRELYEACEKFLDASHRMLRDRKWGFDELEKAFAASSHHAVARLQMHGEFYTDYAWDARGRGYANKVTEEGRRLMAERLGLAETALEEAWRLDPHDTLTAQWMLTVELGQGKGRARMEQWFRRAMAADPDNYQACMSKM